MAVPLARPRTQPGGGHGPTQHVECCVEGHDYPCRCLWRGFLQITSTLPWRRTILHFSHIGLTDGRTFMIPFGWFRTGRLWQP
jgi:hypothetical protein